MNRDEELTLFVGATRYYLGRMTYAVDDFCRILITNWKSFSEETKNTIRRDVETEFDMDDKARVRGDQHKPLGHDCDRKSWERVRNLWVEK